MQHRTVSPTAMQGTFRILAPPTRTSIPPTGQYGRTIRLWGRQEGASSLGGVDCRRGRRGENRSVGFWRIFIVQQVWLVVGCWARNSAKFWLIYESLKGRSFTIFGLTFATSVWYLQSQGLTSLTFWSGFETMVDLNTGNQLHYFGFRCCMCLHIIVSN